MLPGRGEVLPPPCLSRPPFGWKNLLYQRYYYYRLGILASVPWVGRPSEEADVELGGHLMMMIMIMIMMMMMIMMIMRGTSLKLGIL